MTAFNPDLILSPDETERCGTYTDYISAERTRIDYNRKEAMIYMEVLIKGKLDASWSDWFESMTISQAGREDTLLSGDVPDLAAVYGILSRMSSLHLRLVSVSCLESPNQRPPLETTEITGAI